MSNPKTASTMRGAQELHRQMAQLQKRAAIAEHNAQAAEARERQHIARMTYGTGTVATSTTYDVGAQIEQKRKLAELQHRLRTLDGQIEQHHAQITQPAFMVPHHDIAVSSEQFDQLMKLLGGSREKGAIAPVTSGKGPEHLQPSAVKSAPAVKRRVQVYCQGDWLDD